jgi:hypothetical protein
MRPNCFSLTRPSTGGTRWNWLSISCIPANSAWGVILELAIMLDTRCGPRLGVLLRHLARPYLLAEQIGPSQR